jgi:predicted ATPase/class 3 adenylate cyclase
MDMLTTYLPIDRCHAIVQGIDLPDYTDGAALFADVSGFTPLTEALLQTLGTRRGAEELTHQLNRVYDALIPEIHKHRGSVISFSGDAIICWFDGDDGLRATACGLAMQRAIAQFSHTTTPSGVVVSLAMKTAIATGAVRRLLVGDPRIQVMDVIAGATLDRLAAAEALASKGDVVLAPEAFTALEDRITIAEWRHNEQSGARVAVVSGLHGPVTVEPWEPPDSESSNISIDVRPWILPPVYERLRTGQGQFLAEIRPAVALFLSFSGIDYDRDIEAGAQLNAYIQWVQNILAHYEGFLLQLIMGDKGSYLYAAFGAPLAHDDDDARAVAAALDLLALPPDLAYIQHVQIGISRGVMHAGAYGGTARHTYGVLGDEVNLAARLMSKAAPGQILVTGRVAYRTSHVYHLEPMGMVQVKGKQEPVPVSLVRGRKQSILAHPTALFTHRLVGRESELAQFAQVLDMMLHGSGQILRLEGAAGIGKSHLTAAFGEQAHHRAVHVVVGACQSISKNIAYAPWRQVFWSLFDLSEGGRRGQETPLNERELETTIARLSNRLNEMNPNWLLRLPLLGDLLGLPIPDNATTAGFDPRLRQEALFSLIVDLMQTWSRSQPILLLLEDIHWMDEASLDLTLALGRVIAQMPVLLGLVQRPPLDEDHPLLPELFDLPVHWHIKLSELSPEGLEALVTERLQAPVDRLALDLIQAEAQGNPFFIEELVDMLREEDKLCQQDDSTWTLSGGVVNALADAQCLVRDDTGGWLLAPGAPLAAAELGIPDSIHGVVLSRLDRLPEEHKLTLKVASVIGRIFELDILTQVHPARPSQAELLEQIRVLEERDFTHLDVPTPRQTYIFKHSVTQEVSYDTLLESQQRDLHYAVAETLERLQPDAIEQMAYHYSRSGARDKTLLYLDKAARKTQREYANETALAYYTQALELEEQPAWRRGQVEILHTLGRRDEQHEALCILEASPLRTLFEVAYLWGQYYEATGDYDQARVAIERALNDSQQRADKMGEARCLAHLGLIHRRLGDYERARVRYVEALRLFHEELHPSEETASNLASTLNGLGHVYLQQGDLDQAQLCFEQALEMSRTSGHRKDESDALNNLGIMFSHERSFASALTCYQQALEGQRAIGDRAGEGASLGNMARSIQAEGDYGQASEYLTAALAIQQAIGNRWNEINDWNDLGVLYQELGDLNHAQECLQQGLRLSQTIGDEAGQAYILVNLGLVVRDQGDLAAADKLLTDGLTLARAQDDTYLVAGFLSYLGTVSLQMNKAPRAIQQASAALALQQELDLHLETTHDLATLAVASLASGDAAGALRYAEQALGILDECGGKGPEFPQRDYFLCSQVLEATGHPARARAALQSAYDLVLARADNITDAALRRSFLERVPINRQIMQAMQAAQE